MSILISKFNKNNINIAIISINTYCITNKLKKIQVFAIFIRDLEFKVAKKAKLKTYLKGVISEKYYDFLDIFKKKI